MNPSRGQLTLLACNSGKYFAEQMLNTLKTVRKRNDAFRLVPSTEVAFPNGEVKVTINEAIRGDDVYIVQALEDPLAKNSINDRLMALITAIDAARRSDAAYVSAILLPYPYSRQDKQKAREAITAGLVAYILENIGADNVLTLDVHAEAIAGFFRKATFFNVFPTHTIVRFLKKNFAKDMTNLTVVSPDVGGAVRARFYAKILHADLALINKERDYSSISRVEKVTLIGHVKDKNVLIVDDMVDTAGTMYSVAKLMKEKGAKNIYLATSYALLHGPALDRLRQLHHDGMMAAFIATDAVYRGEEFKKQQPWFYPVTIAPFFAKIINHINHLESTTTLLEEEYS